MTTTSSVRRTGVFALVTLAPVAPLALAALADGSASTTPTITASISTLANGQYHARPDPKTRVKPRPPPQRCPNLITRWPPPARDPAPERAWPPGVTRERCAANREPFANG